MARMHPTELHLSPRQALVTWHDDAEVLRTEAMLAAGVPLSLLLDLAEPDGPSSRQLFSDEGGTADWLTS